jgi:hypothetical protein
LLSDGFASNRFLRLPLFALDQHLSINTLPRHLTYGKLS